MFLNKEYETRILNQTTTPPSTPPRKGTQSPGGDRFIPSRKDNHWETRFATFSDTSNGNTSALEKTSCENAESRRDGTAYKCVLKNDLLGANIDTLKDQYNDQSLNLPHDGRNLFEYLPPAQVPASPYSLSPLSIKSQQLLSSPLKKTQKIPTVPFKVLDAPELEDDFYLNLVDWSSENVLAVGLSSSVYLWSASSSDVTRLCNLAPEDNSITSVAWNDKGNLVAVGTQSGYVQIWDVAVNKQVNKLVGHSARVGALAWNGDIITSGSRDKDIFLRDVRTPCLVPEKRLVGHRQEVCGLKWSPDKLYLASGGNDNRLNVWNLNSLSPVQTYTQHVAAVKAIAWSPHQRGLLASGGGTADCHIRFWNTLTGQPKQSINTGSQVCNLVWSKHTQEFVSTHGYSQYEILVWKYPSLVQVAKLTGHSCRVLYLAMAPNGETIVTGAGEGSLKFWNVFRKAGSQKENKSVLRLFSSIR